MFERVARLAQPKVGRAVGREAGGRCLVVVRAAAVEASQITNGPCCSTPSPRGLLSDTRARCSRPRLRLPFLLLPAACSASQLRRLVAAAHRLPVEMSIELSLHARTEPADSWYGELLARYALRCCRLVLLFGGGALSLRAPRQVRSVAATLCYCLGGALNLRCCSARVPLAAGTARRVPHQWLPGGGACLCCRRFGVILNLRPLLCWVALR